MTSPNDHLLKHDISTQDQCLEVKSPASRDHRWYQGLSLHVDQDILGGRIVAYKIRWFNGKWSGWFVPGVNDIDHKFNDSNWPGNTARHNTMRRRWSCFYDHEHLYIIHRSKKHEDSSIAHPSSQHSSRPPHQQTPHDKNDNFPQPRPGDAVLGGEYS